MLCHTKSPRNAGWPQVGAILELSDGCIRCASLLVARSSGYGDGAAACAVAVLSPVSPARGSEQRSAHSNE
eukprot:5971203-Pleurochrysis_carterae.AAC.1